MIAPADSLICNWHRALAQGSTAPVIVQSARVLRIGEVLAFEGEERPWGSGVYARCRIGGRFVSRK